MKPLPEITIYNHQQAIPVSDELIELYEAAAMAALPHVLKCQISDSSVLNDLKELEVSLVDDDTIADVHKRFLNIPGATDVITFDHGEIHVSVETARLQAQEFANGYEREVMLYIIHGLLHLAGHDDMSEQDRVRMDHHQQRILKEVWTSEL